VRWAQTGSGSFLDGYSGSIAMNQQSVHVGHPVVSPFEHRQGSRLHSQSNGGHLVSITHDIHNLFPRGESHVCSSKQLRSLFASSPNVLGVRVQSVQWSSRRIAWDGNRA
jgi:hypothetical protein